MSIKTYLAGLCVAAIAVAVPAVPQAEAQTDQVQKKYTRTAKADRPRSRVTVAPRSFLDAGTEVKPGERKFTDYAYPPGNVGIGISAVTNTGGKVGWAVDPFIPWPQLGGFNRW